MNKKVELKFPLTCSYRIITLDLPNIDFVIETVLEGMGFSCRLKKGNTSETGKYLTYSTKITLESRDIMEKVNQELTHIEGVKMVL